MADLIEQPKSEVPITAKDVDAAALAGLQLRRDLSKLADERIFQTVHANEDQLETVRRALNERPAKADWLAAILSIAGAIVTAWKVLKDAPVMKDPSGASHWSLDAWALVVLGAVFAPAVIAAFKAGSAICGKGEANSQNTHALQIVDRLIQEQKRANPAQTGHESATKQ